MEEALGGRVHHETRRHRDQVEAAPLERLERGPDHPGARPGVGVERDQPPAGRRLQPLLQGPLLADPSGGQRATLDQPDATVSLGRCAHDRGGAVARLVVHHQDLTQAGLAGQPFQARGDALGLVACGDHDFVCGA